jgi:hypothetical protein
MAPVAGFELAFRESGCRARQVAQRRQLEVSMRNQPDKRKAKMSRLLERLLMWVADILDRSLLTVPDLDDERPSPRP